MEISKEKLHKTLREEAVKVVTKLSKDEEGYDFDFALSLTKVLAMYAAKVELELIGEE